MPQVDNATAPATAAATCLRCNGTGQWVNPRNSADIRPCFGCQPTARPRFYRRPYAAPVAAPAIAPEEVARRQAIAAAAFDPAALTGHDATCYARTPAVFRWLWDNAASNEFAASLLRGLRRYGGLTPRQQAAVERNLQRATDERAEPRRDVPAAEMAAVIQRAIDANPERFAPAPTPVTFDIARIAAALDAAAASGLRKVRLTFGAMELRLSGPTFRAGSGLILVYFNEAGANNARQRFGSADYLGYIQRNGEFRPAARLGMNPPPAGALDMLRTICADPAAASRTFGHDTGHCACCRRLLTDPPSVMAGIGPVCAQRFGFSF